MAITIQQAAEIAKSKTTNKRWHSACDKAVAGASTWIITELANSTAITTDVAGPCGWRPKGIATSRLIAAGCARLRLARSW
jgi:hypothetical protein